VFSTRLEMCANKENMVNFDFMMTLTETKTKNIENVQIMNY